ncbi:malonyl-ACP O-methyltransferase BioC [Marinimicrobium alkaliphilum]|uniref:malonyl-ACP O-methyltransferase BioC n=1 Tax=Marinimicrobium alkaliphilum TaxID=2202654 RepID=UPI000DB909F1|nr:malonyl-ACP O-methyltransferase BioC [Marinimicrobium alkaliphilum]
MALTAARPERLSLAVQRHPATRPEQALAEPLVLLHGWGCDSRSWAPLLPHLQQLGEVWTLDLPGFGGSEPLLDGAGQGALEALLTRIEDSLPARAVLLGWSFGGMLATALAARQPERITHLVTLASNLCFVARPEWPAAMPKAVNRQFNKSFEQQPEQTLKHFAGLLAKGDGAERALLKQLRPLFTDARLTPDWAAALALLARMDNRAAYAQLRQPGLHLLAEQDALVPAEALGAMQTFNPAQQLALIPSAAHALHWSQPEAVAQEIAQFLRPATLDKRRVAQSFSKAAATYDSVARLQRAVGEHLLTQLPSTTFVSDAQAPMILDLGCGTGYFTEQLALRSPGAQVIGLDIAEGMLQFARRERPGPGYWLGGDAESLPLADASIDIIYSSLAIQWCSDLPALFAELRRVLKPGGHLLFSTLGPQTLWELKRAWQQVDGYTHVNRFATATAVRQALDAAGLAERDWQAQTRVLGYPKLHELTRELKALGAHNINSGQAAGLTGRHKIDALKLAYEQHRDAEGWLPASYQVFYGQAQAQVTSDS